VPEGREELAAGLAGVEMSGCFFAFSFGELPFAEGVEGVVPKAARTRRRRFGLFILGGGGLEHKKTSRRGPTSARVVRREVDRKTERSKENEQKEVVGTFGSWIDCPACPNRTLSPLFCRGPT
jgi:hypothetical protein